MLSLMRKKIRMTDFTKILDKAKELESKMKESQEKIKKIQVEGISGSNSVKVTLNGENEMIKIKDNHEIKKLSNSINSFDDLLEICATKKEIELKYELEKNINLVSFENQRIEISFNEDLDKDFIKDLSLKLYEWTDNRWIITLSKVKGQPSKKETEVNLKKELIDSVKNSSIYKVILEKFPDIELIDVEANETENKND